MPEAFDISDWPELPKLRGLFVTGTDTEVGKTLIAGAIVRSLRSEGRRVEVFKPAASGCVRRRGGLAAPDAEFLAACADSQRSLEEICPQRFAAALAPNVAAGRAGAKVDVEAILSAYSRMEGQADGVVVEGVGGLLCPISEDFWVIHLAMLARLPVVIVARPGLGTINHTLLTVHAARSAGLEVAGVVINRYRLEPPPGGWADDADVAMATNPQQIAERGGVKVLALVPDESANSVENCSIGPDTQFTVDQVDWWGRME